VDDLLLDELAIALLGKAQQLSEDVVVVPADSGAGGQLIPIEGKSKPLYSVVLAVDVRLCVYPDARRVPGSFSAPGTVR